MFFMNITCFVASLLRASAIFQSKLSILATISLSTMLPSPELSPCIEGFHCCILLSWHFHLDLPALINICVMQRWPRALLNPRKLSLQKNMCTRDHLHTPDLNGIAGRPRQAHCLSPKQAPHGPLAKQWNGRQIGNVLCAQIAAQSSLGYIQFNRTILTSNMNDSCIALVYIYII